MIFDEEASDETLLLFHLTLRAQDKDCPGGKETFLSARRS
jgi:hypothetical protein